MTREEARKMIREGHKLTNNYFSPEEYVHLVKGVETFEDGVKVPHWWWEKDFVADGWRRWEEKP